MVRLASFGCILAIAVMGDVWYSLQAYNDRPTETVQAAHFAPQTTKPISKPGGSLDAWTATILARPLLSADRRPDVSSAVAADPTLPRLSGVVISSSETVAIFQPTGNSKPVVVRHGEMVSGWTVMTVTDEGVGLLKDHNSIMVRPTFDGAAAPVVKRLWTRWEVAGATGVLRDRWSNPHLQP